MRVDNDILTARILMVDDEPVNVALLEQALRGAGFSNLRGITDPREVAGVYEEFSPDIVLLDLRMPHLDGFRVMEQIRRGEKDSFLPIVILTAQSDEDTCLRALEAGATDFLGKPLNLLEVICRIRNMIETRLLHKRIKNHNLDLEEKVRVRTEEIKRYSVSLETANQELKDFLHAAWHFLQEPLRKALVFNDRLRELHPASPADAETDYLDRLRNNIFRMRTLLRDLSLYSETIARKQRIECVNLDRIVRELLCEELESAIRGSGGIVTVQNLPTIQADKEQMRLLFKQLIANALKFHRKEEPPRVTVRGEPATDGGWRIEVEDNGIGVKGKYISGIFKPFQKLHGAQYPDGTGIGLSLCRKIVAAHNGEITVKSTPNLGSTFSVILPQDERM